MAERGSRVDVSNARAWLARTGIVVPAFDAASTIEQVVRGLVEAIPECARAIVVVDDGSRDGTGALARALGCEVIAHSENRGKGCALRTGLEAARARGKDLVLTVDADGQHPAAAAREVLLASDDEEALVLGVRDLAGAGAPRANQMSNRISNYFISRLAGRVLADTQCGLRRYPVRSTLALDARGDRYDFEAEVLMRAAWARMPIVERKVTVLYPPDRTTHFHVVRDPARIIQRVVTTLADHVRGRA